MARKKPPKVHPFSLAHCQVRVEQLTEDHCRQLAAIALQLQYLHVDARVFWAHGGCSIEDEQLADAALDQLDHLVRGIVESEGGEC